MLKLTYKDLEDILHENFERFSVLKNGIPYEDGENPNNYIEDDGRQYRIVEFKDLDTGITYYFQYIWHIDCCLSFPGDFFIEPDGIEWVNVSVINPPKPIKEAIIPLTPEQEADKNLWQRYLDTPDKRPFVSLKDSGVSKKTLEDIYIFLQSPFSMFQLRAKIIPICIEHKLEEKSFWNFIQRKSRKKR